MGVPKQVQAQLDAADRILEQANNPPAPPAAAPPDLANLAPEPVVANAPSAPPEPPTPAAPVVDKPPYLDEEKTWHERYKALKGMYEKSVPELQGQVRQLTSDLTQMQRQLQEAQTAKPQPQQPPAPTADPQDVEAFGEDLVNMVKRTAERMFAGSARAVEAALGRTEARISELEKRLQGTTETALNAAERAFLDRLTKLVPNWEEINEDERFKAWCLEVDPVYGVPRQRALNAAQDAMDADRAAAAFKAYLALQAPPPTKTAPPVETQVSPRAVASAPPPAPSNKPVITAAQVDMFYREVAQGKYRGREAEQQRIELVINDALAEGRIR